VYINRTATSSGLCQFNY